MVRTSERKAFRTCPQAWWWQYREGLTPKGRPAGALWFGTGVHFALAEWYQPGLRRGVRPATTFNKWVGKETHELIAAGKDKFGETEYEDARVLGVSMLQGYIEKYGKDESLETIAVEQPFQIDILDEDGNYVCTAVGTLDGVTYDNLDGFIYLWEHKTAAQISTAFLSLDDQAGTYFAVSSIVLREQGLLAKDERIAGVLYNYLRKGKPDDRPKDERGHYLNKDGSVSAKQPAPLYHREVIERNAGEVNRQIARLRDDAVHMMAVREGKMPLIKNTNFRCPQCKFFELCQLDEKGNQKAVTAYKRLSFTVQDPYADHRKSASE
jgi:hypothetical protein